MTTLRIVTDTNDESKIEYRTDIETAGAADKKASILKYLRSLECEAEKQYADDDDWRYGRYLVQGLLIAAIDNADKFTH